MADKNDTLLQGFKKKRGWKPYNDPNEASQKEPFNNTYKKRCLFSQFSLHFLLKISLKAANYLKNLMLVFYLFQTLNIQFIFY